MENDNAKKNKVDLIAQQLAELLVLIIDQKHLEDKNFKKIYEKRNKQ